MRHVGTIGNDRLLAMLLDCGAPARLFGAPIVRTLIEIKWSEYGLQHLWRQGGWFLLQFALFVAFQVGVGLKSRFCCTNLPLLDKFSSGCRCPAAAGPARQMGRLNYTAALQH
jgi:hypothetical protein